MPIALDLHRDPLPVGEAGGVHLGDAPRSHRHQGEVDEVGAPRRQLGVEHGCGRLRRLGSDTVVQTP